MYLGIPAALSFLCNSVLVHVYEVAAAWPVTREISLIIQLFITYRSEGDKKWENEVGKLRLTGRELLITVYSFTALFSVVDLFIGFAEYFHFDVYCHSFQANNTSYMFISH